MRKPRKTELQTVREDTAWRMRIRGHTQEEIADELGLNQATVSRLLARLNDRALKRNEGRVERHKVEQTQILWHSVSQAMRAWEASKEPLHRVRQTEDGQTVTEVVRREGNVQYLHTVFKALSDIRSIWGLDIAPQTVEPVQGIAQLLREMESRGVAHEARQADEAAAGDTGGLPPVPGSGAAEVQEGPGPIQ